MTLQIDPAVMQQLGSASETCEADIEKLLSNITSQVKGIAGDFKGAGATAFFELYEAWALQMRSTVRSLDQFQENLRFTNTQQDDADNEAVAQANSMRAKLDGLGLTSNVNG